jgi:hypothetical protein
MSATKIPRTKESQKIEKIRKRRRRRTKDFEFLRTRTAIGREETSYLSWGSMLPEND